MFGACWVASHQCECLGNFSWNIGVLCSFIPCTALAVCEQPRVPVAMKRWAAWAGAGEFPVPQVVLVRRGGRAGLLDCGTGLGTGTVLALHTDVAAARRSFA